MIVGIGTPHADEFVPRDAESLWVAAHVLSEETLIEIIMTSGNRSVTGIEARCSYEFESLAESATFVNVVAKALEVA